MTELTTVDAPVAIPASREVTGEDHIRRPFKALLGRRRRQLRRRLAATRPDKEIVTHESQGAHKVKVRGPQP